MTAPLAPGLLTVRDSQILELLRGGATPERVTEVGAYRRSWTADDVERVALAHGTTNAPRPRRPAATKPRKTEQATTAWTPPVSDTPPRTVTLSAREVDVLNGMCRGLGNRAIGAELYITEDTVKTYVKRLLAALGTDNRTHAVALAVSGQVEIRHHNRRTT